MIDVSDPTNPELVGNFDTRGDARGVTVVGNFALVADHTFGLQMIDVSDPTNPRIKGNYDSPGLATRVAVAGNYAYLADGSGGLRAVQVFQSEFDIDRNRGQSLTVNDGIGLVGSAKLTTTQTDGVIWKLSADGGTNWQFFAPDGNWHAFYNPGQDLRWRSTHLWGGMENPTVSEMAVSWVEEEVSGVPAQSGFALHGAAPNPFNPATTLSFEIPARMGVSLKVFDLTGGVVDVLVDGMTLDRGRHEVVWRGQDRSGRRVPSGAYFYRLEAGEYSAVRGMVLMK